MSVKHLQSGDKCMISRDPSRPDFEPGAAELQIEVQNAQRHVVVVQPGLAQVFHGMQRDFEQAICDVNGASVVQVPPRAKSPLARRLTDMNTRAYYVAAPLPRRRLDIEGDVLWLVLMAPYDYPLWHFKGWEDRFKTKILYVFDALPPVFYVLKRILRRTDWDLTVSSFPDSLPGLERATGRRWHGVMQGISPSRFYPSPQESPPIAFCSFGRREERVHQIVKDFVRRRNLHYEYSTSTCEPLPGVDPRENYESYAWHLRNSWFSICWPVEATHPQRAVGMSPITCRWFEAAASGSVIVGRGPKDPAFVSAFGPNLVECIDPAASEAQIHAELNRLWEDRVALRQRALRLASQRSKEWTWEARVREILHLIASNPSAAATTR